MTVAKSADGRLVSLYSEEWAWRQRAIADVEDGQLPVSPSLPEIDHESQESLARRWQQTLDALLAIPYSELSPEQRLNFDVYRSQLERLLESQRLRQYEMPVNSDSSFWSDLAYTARRPFRSRDDFSNWVSKLRELPRYVAQQQELMQAGMARGFTPPRASMAGRERGLDAFLGADPTTSPLFTPFTRRSPLLSDGEFGRLAAEAGSVLQELVRPSLKEFRSFLGETYLPNCRATTAAADLPDGEEYYGSLIRQSTTLELDAPGLHRLGLEAVEEVHQEMAEVAAAAHLPQGIPGLRQRLQADPDLHAKSPQELLERAAFIAKTVDGRLGDFFGLLPRARFTIRPVPEEMAFFYTAGRGGPGTYLVNTYQVERRPLYNLWALTLHEAEPGHAMQMSLALENPSLPDFRRHSYISAFGEGWALYCERLGLEMGIYPTRLDHLGMLGYQSWRACRLVVDTGIHALGWSRARAVTFLREHTLLPDHELETEVDRYISWPAQALSYYVGQSVILELRAQAERALGARFDVRWFHDSVLALGCVPLPVLRNQLLKQLDRCPQPGSGSLADRFGEAASAAGCPQDQRR